MNSNILSAIFSVFLLCLFVSCVSGLKCYSCDSSSNPLTCNENVFVSLGITQADGCPCCTKSVGDDTKRECPGVLDAYKCVPTSSNHVCMSDLCNGATRRYNFQFSVLAGAAILVLSAILFGAR